MEKEGDKKKYERVVKSTSSEKKTTKWLLNFWL